MLATTTIGLGEATIDDGVAYWLESRPTEGGRFVVVKGDPHTDPVDVTPRGSTPARWCTSTAAVPTRSATARCSSRTWPTQRLYRQDPGSAPVPITPETDATQRFADGQITPDGRWWIGVRERHDLGPAMVDVVNELVAVPTDGSADPRTIVGGHDFFSSPRISADGSTLGVALVGPAVDAVGRHRAVRRAALGRGGARRRLHRLRGVQGRSRSGTRNGARREISCSRRIAAAGGTLSECATVFGPWCSRPRRSSATRSGAWVSTRSLLGRWAHRVSLRPGRRHAYGDRRSRDGGARRPGPAAGRVAIGARDPGRGFHHRAHGRVGNRTGSGDLAGLRRALDRGAAGEPRVPVEQGHLSVPEAIEFPTDGGLRAHAFFYPPTNQDATGPEGDRPPLIVISHGGPTSANSSALDLGFAVLHLPRVRRGRCELRRFHGLRPRLPRSG